MFKGKIFIASDHAGFRLKNIIKKYLIKERYNLKDLGPKKYKPTDDYPDYAIKVVKKVLKTKDSRGILICGSGQGMAIVANRFKGIYAVVCWNKTSAKKAREEENSNILCLGARLIKPKTARSIVKVWLETPFTYLKRHLRRINKIKKIKNNGKKRGKRKFKR